MKVLGVNWHGRRYTHPESGMEVGNVGDANCSPLQYFAFPKARLLDLSDTKRRHPTAVICGGGSYPKRLRKIARRHKAAIRVAWGVGWTERGQLRPMAPDIHVALAKRFHLYGHRDWGCTGEYVPCVSAMAPHFDQAYPVEHEVAFFGHPTDCPRPRPDDLPGPTMFNDEMDFAKVVRFLASADTIVTGSYHGVYWATLLGRRVICHPYSAKFWHFKHPPVLTEDWRSGMRAAARYEGVLEESRALNVAFHAKVMDLLQRPARP